MRLEFSRLGSSLVLMARHQVSGSAPSSLFETAIESVIDAVKSEGCTLADAVFHRLWTSSREVRDFSAGPRARYFDRANRTASSSFISAAQAPGEHGLAIEVAFLPGAAASGKRVVDFDPPRRYAHYATAKGLLYLSGMAEEAPTIAQQFELSMEQIQRALDQECVTWSDAKQISIFLETGCGDLAQIKSMLDTFAPGRPDMINLELVDGLASPGKHLEIEIVGILPSRQGSK